MSLVRSYPMPDVLVRARAEVGESPAFDPRTGHLTWVDITRGILREDNLATGDFVEADLGILLGAAIPRTGGSGFAVAVAEGFGRYVDGVLTVDDPVLPEPELRMNDAKCDSRGRLWAGSTHMEFERGRGRLHRWDGTGPSKVHAEGFTLANGLGWSPDDTVMYLIDSENHHLLSAPYDAEVGEVGAFTELARIEQGLPDGLAVDAEGGIWIAVWGGSVVLRLDPAGRLIGELPMPVSQPASCAFDGTTLVVTTASAGLAAGAETLAGSVFAVETGVGGVPVAGFAG